MFPSAFARDSPVVSAGFRPRLLGYARRLPLNAQSCTAMRARPLSRTMAAKSIFFPVARLSFGSPAIANPLQ